ncbi:hypothetical protein Tco_0320783 [Tanacetum coccineum]
MVNFSLGGPNWPTRRQKALIVILHVIALGSTNHVVVLDQTLRRSRIFNCVVMVETAYMVRRQAILHVHATKKELPIELPFGGDVDPANIACVTIGFTGNLKIGKCNSGVLCQRCCRVIGQNEEDDLTTGKMILRNTN